MNARAKWNRVGTFHTTLKTCSSSAFPSAVNIGDTVAAAREQRTSTLDSAPSRPNSSPVKCDPARLDPALREAFPLGGPANFDNLS